MVLNGERLLVLMDLFPPVLCSICEKGTLLCKPGACSQSCGWSAWSPWTACDRSCGSGVRARFRCGAAARVEEMGREDQSRLP
jgi:hypothetical protein